MIKKIFISLLFFATHNNYIFSMDEITSSNTTIDYDHFFELCRIGEKIAIKNFIKKNPMLNINYQNNYGTTPLLYAATWGSWEIVWYLLKHNANKMMKDNYGQTLFSKAAYNLSSTYFKKLLKIYSLDEINELCKTICLKREIDNPAKFNLEWVNTILLNALNNKKNLNEKQNGDKTVLHRACIYSKAPLIIELLKCGADLDIKDNSGESCYDCLYTEKMSHERAPLFVVREAFNNGPCIQAALMNKVFKKIDKKIDRDVSYYIKKLYVEHIVVQDKLFESAKARILKYTCIEACKQGGLIKPNEKADEKRCLATIMLLPQNKLTEINIQLALADK